MVWSSAPRNIASMMPSTIALISGWVSGRGSGSLFAARGLDLAGLATMVALDAARTTPLQWGKCRGDMSAAAGAKSRRPTWEAESIMRASAIAAALSLLALTSPTAGRDALPAGLVYLRDIDASIVQDMRYAGSDNFVGRAI